MHPLSFSLRRRREGARSPSAPGPLSKPWLTTSFRQGVRRGQFWTTRRSLTVRAAAGVPAVTQVHGLESVHSAAQHDSPAGHAAADRGDGHQGRLPWKVSKNSTTPVAGSPVPSTEAVSQTARPARATLSAVLLGSGDPATVAVPCAMADWLLAVSRTVTETA